MQVWFVCAWQVKLCDPLAYTGHIYMCFRDEVLYNKVLYKIELSLLYFSSLLSLTKDKVLLLQSSINWFLRYPAYKK